MCGLRSTVRPLTQRLQRAAAFKPSQVIPGTAHQENISTLRFSSHIEREAPFVLRTHQQHVQLTELTAQFYTHTVSVESRWSPGEVPSSPPNVLFQSLFLTIISVSDHVHSSETVNLGDLPIDYPDNILQETFYCHSINALLCYCQVCF